MITFKYKDEDALIIRKLSYNDAHTMDRVIREFIYFLKGLSYSDTLINRYVNDPDLIRYTKQKKKKKKNVL